MGSSSSKPNAKAEPSSSSSSSAGVRRSRSKGSRVFQSSCLGPPSGSSDSDTDDPKVSNHQCMRNDDEGCEVKNKVSMGEVKAKCYRNIGVEKPDDMACMSSNVGLDEWGSSTLSGSLSERGSTSSRVFSSRSLNLSSRFLSRFNFFPGNMSFRLSRATSLDSSRAYPSHSTTSSDQEPNLQSRSNSGVVNRSESAPGCDFLSACLYNRPSRQEYDDFPCGSLSSNLASGSSNNVAESQIISSQYPETSTLEFNINLRSPRNNNTEVVQLDGFETRFTDRPIGAREPMERNVRFSRTLSVGRLRDRVLRRSSFPDIPFCPIQQETEMVNASQGRGRQVFTGGTSTMSSDDNAGTSPTSSGYVPSNRSRSLYSFQDSDMETSRAREQRYHEMLEQRSNFHERRRRIRSQVRALQRLGSRFETSSGHERSCILSGQHRPGHCTCRGSTRDATNDDTSARASISRIVMLAEALFEVLDEIHQQSVVLSSQPSVSSIGSGPAPNEVVESLPVKVYNKSKKLLSEEAAQCYICLVEYEEGDIMRILPCHHEFHRVCIDKWLKEIHRVCPLCRGNICRSESLPTAD